MYTSLLNIAGLIFAFAGAVLLYCYVPSLWKLNSEGDVTFTADPEFDRQKKLAGCGLSFVAVGFFAQLAASIFSLSPVPPIKALQRIEASESVYSVPDAFRRQPLSLSLER